MDHDAAALRSARARGRQCFVDALQWQASMDRPTDVVLDIPLQQVPRLDELLRFNPDLGQTQVLRRVPLDYFGLGERNRTTETEQQRALAVVQFDFGRSSPRSSTALQYGPRGVGEPVIPVPPHSADLQQDAPDLYAGALRSAAMSFVDRPDDNTICPHALSPRPGL
jgi:hypothetical protein